MHVGAIADERRIQRAEGIPLRVGITAQMRLHLVRDAARSARAGLPPSRHSAARRPAKAPAHTAHSQTPVAPPRPRASTRAASLSSFAGLAGRNAVRAIAATFVNRQSSSCVVGNPVSQKRANASSRSLPQPGQFLPRRRPRELREVFQPALQLFHRRHCRFPHARAPTGCRASCSVQP